MPEIEHKGPPGGGTWVHDGMGGFTRPAGYAEGMGAEAPVSDSSIAGSGEAAGGAIDAPAHPHEGE